MYRPKLDRKMNIVITESDVEGIFGLRASGPDVLLTDDSTKLESLAFIYDRECGPLNMVAH